MAACSGRCGVVGVGRHTSILAWIGRLGVALVDWIVFDCLWGLTYYPRFLDEKMGSDVD
jgi:hypothetical protein